jgi:hypothetical protein
MRKRFSAWARWADRACIDGLRWPGVYVLAISDEDIAGSHFSWHRDVVYVGMTNSKGGLKSRLKQFDDTVRGKESHGGAQRVRFKHRNYEKLKHRLYVAVSNFDCEVTSNRPEDLRIMGAVACFEFECLAAFAEVFGSLPEFNDRRRSPKKEKANKAATTK